MDGEELLRIHPGARQVMQRLGFRSVFKDESFGREKPGHRRGLARAPVIVERDRDGADFPDSQKRLKMLGAAAAGKSYEIPLVNAVLQQVTGETIDARGKLPKRQ